MSSRSSTFICCFFILISALFIQCTRGKYAGTDKVYKRLARDYSKTIRSAPAKSQSVDSLGIDKQYWVGTVNFGIRRPNFVVIHHTAQDSTAQTLRTFTITTTQVSAHYVIGRDGVVYHMVNDYLRAQHAGESRWGNNSDLNSSSIGIELDNNGNEPYSDAQIVSLCAVLETLKRRYKIPAANFIGHADIAPTRKPDPNNFPWKTLAGKGYGLWYDEVLETSPIDFDPVIALRSIGYDVRNMEAAVVAFKRHFIQTDISPVLTDYDRSVLYNLYRKYI